MGNPYHPKKEQLDHQEWRRLRGVLCTINTTASTCADCGPREACNSADCSWREEPDAGCVNATRGRRPRETRMVEGDQLARATWWLERSVAGFCAKTSGRPSTPEDCAAQPGGSSQVEAPKGGLA